MAELIRDIDNKVSSKRIIVLTSMACFIGFSFIDIFTKFTVSGYIFDALIWIIVAGLGVVGSEKYFKGKNKGNG